MNRIDYLRNKAQALPEQPGVYIMKNARSEIIYIGKAKVLKNRVSQYFGSQNKHSTKVKRMVENVYDFDYIIVSSEFEALILECSLIKQNMPKYNILLKDDKGYTYVKLEDNGWKKISSVFQKNDDNATYYGPYTSSDYVSTAVKEATDIFMLPHCNKKFPDDIKKKGRPCLNYHIKICSGACSGKISVDENNQNVDDALRFVLGGKTDLINSLRTQMEQASERLDFERAAKIRDKLRSIEKVSQKQHVVALKIKNQDIFGIESIEEKTCVNILTVRNGTIINTENFILDRLEESEDEYVQLLANYYSEKHDLPDRICVEFDLSNADYLLDFLYNISNKKVALHFPKSGESASLMKMAKSNAREKLSRVLSYNNKSKAALYELKELLGLEEFPSIIEAYDISNMNGSENVGGMVVFVNGKPDKKRYRRFAIKSFEGQDDYRSLAEVLNRRIGEYYINIDGGDEFGDKPDLILLDGGTGQVNAVKEILEKRGFDVPLFGMVKDGKHRTRAIATGGREITINDNRSVFTLISDIQEEVHRYAISYHHKLKQKNALTSSLLSIPGIGEKRTKNLLLKFGSVSKIKEASIEELASVKGITESQALIIRNYFN
ncbi:MAG: excinuclease ABC subunit UvrC [Clostridia bacterium]|nr:excinuclease ABC subunit UvrC [Clostridia bacterium]